LYNIGKENSFCPTKIDYSTPINTKETIDEIKSILINVQTLTKKIDNYNVILSKIDLLHNISITNDTSLNNFSPYILNPDELHTRKAI
jgi:hypothetical protein